MTVGSTSFDVIVVGAGIVGLAHAYEAARRGLKVCVLDRDAACVSASIRNFGFVTVTGQGAGDTWRRARHARDVWAELAPKAGIAVQHQGLNLIATRDKARDVLQAFMQTDMAQSVNCALWTAEEAARHAPELRLNQAKAVLHSPIDLRVESRDAIAQLTRWLAEQMQVTFRFGEAVLEVATPKVVTAKGQLHAERVVVCTNADIHGLYSALFAKHQVQLCQLQMLRVQPAANLRLNASVMGDLSLVRYHGYSKLPEARALLEQLQQEEGESLAQGIHLIVVQSADGSLVVGDSHHYGASVKPFAQDDVDALMLRHMREALNIGDYRVTERWVGIYPSAPQTDCFIEAPDSATRVAIVTSGTGASTGFGVAHDTFADW
ncbi:MAG: TIGR03364 family FAD-dependent oxidoreductase [Comamonas sp.]|jgi:FAD dependent oxidoreductase TIGR03364|nr:TIGR03364 family FAD-dependent oxidoreductase [Comamonas sp.]